MTTSHLHAHLRLRDTIVDLIALLLLAAVVFALGGCGPAAEFADGVFATTDRDDQDFGSTSNHRAAVATVAINHARWDGQRLVVDGFARAPSTVDLYDADTGEELATTRSRMTRVYGNYWEVTIDSPDFTPRRVRAVVNAERVVAPVAGKPTRQIARDEAVRSPHDRTSPAT